MSAIIGYFEDSLKHRAHGNYDFTINGKCSGCGDCCSNFLPLSQREINQIKIYMKKHDIIEQKHISNVLAVETRDMMCPFADLTVKNKCTIYPVRPIVCREFICSQRLYVPSKEVRDSKIRNVRETFFKEEIK